MPAPDNHWTQMDGYGFITWKKVRITLEYRTEQKIWPISAVNTEISVSKFIIAAGWRGNEAMNLHPERTGFRPRHG